MAGDELLQTNSIQLDTSAETILHIVEAIEPYDALEAEHKGEVIQWILSGAPLFRIAKPADPPMHLVSYFVVFDEVRESLLLVDHVKAMMWLPTGGHVEPGEHPRTTVEREIIEELGIPARFTTSFGSDPLFLTSTTTVGLTAGHTDVSLWYVVADKMDVVYQFDRSEFSSIAWFSFEDIISSAEGSIDSNLKRFVGKMLSNHVSVA